MSHNVKTTIILSDLLKLLGLMDWQLKDTQQLHLLDIKVFLQYADTVGVTWGADTTPVKQ